MAKPNTAKGTKLRLFMESAPGSGVFTAFCGLTAKSINFQTNTNETVVPDCDNPDDPAWRELTKVSRFADISGSGLMDLLNARPRYWAAYNSADAVNMRVEIDVPLAQGGGYWEGAFMVTGMNVGGNDGELVNVELAIGSSGEVAWVDAVA